MDVRKPVLELKDVPPPPLHSAPHQPLALAPLPASSPGHPSSDAQTHKQSPPQPQPVSPKVSLCFRCECTLHSQQHPGSYEARTHSFGDTLGGGCNISSSSSSDVNTVPAPHFSNAQLMTPQSFGFPMTSVATSQPVATRSHPSCCASLRSFSSISVGCAQSRLAPGSAPMHGCCHCSDEHFHSHGDTLSTHFCANPLHLSVEHSAVCLKGAHYCHQCFPKVGGAVYLHSFPCF